MHETCFKCRGGVGRGAVLAEQSATAAKAGIEKIERLNFLFDGRAFHHDNFSMQGVRYSGIGV